MTAPKSIAAIKLEFFDRLVRDPRLKGLDVRVAWRIVDRANSDFTAWPSFELLASELGASARSAMRSIERLCALGWIGKVKGGGRSRYNRYTLKIETVTAVSEFSVSTEKAETVTRVSGNCDNPGRKTVTRLSPESLKESIQESLRAEAGAAPKGAPASALARKRFFSGPRVGQDRGMPQEPIDDTPWQRLKAEIAGHVGDQPVGIWLDILTFIGVRDGVVHLSAPSEIIQEFARRVVADGLGDANRVDIAVRAASRAPRKSSPYASSSKAWKASRHARVDSQQRQPQRIGDSMTILLRKTTREAG